MDATNEKAKTIVSFKDERDYAAARNIVNTLVEKNLLTEEEVKEIDAILRQQFSPVFTSYIADYPAY